MAKPFSIQDYKAKNSWKTGAIEKEVGDTPFKGGHNDIRKTNYDVNIVDGKLDLNTHKTVITESADDARNKKRRKDLSYNLFDAITQLGHVEYDDKYDRKAKDEAMRLQASIGKFIKMAHIK